MTGEKVDKRMRGWGHLFKWIPPATGLLLAITFPIYAIKVYEKRDYTDFSVYYLAAQRAQSAAATGAWDQVYNLKDGASPFRYPPLFLPFFRPFAELGILQAQLLWYGLQFFWFALGFYFIHRSLKIIEKRKSWVLSPPLRGLPSALPATCLGVLFILRFCLDTFTIGQVSSLMFCGFSFGFYSWIMRRPVSTALGILVPTLFKIGPGFLFGVFASGRAKARWMGAATALLVTSILVLLPALWTGSWQSFKVLWSDWSQVVANDSVYYDSSHYGSQSINSFLLRGIRQGWLNALWADRLYLSLAITICIGIAAFWFFRRGKHAAGRGLFFSLGLFAYIWLMPETFKYSLTPLAIPVVLIFTVQAQGKWTQRWKRLSLGFGILTLSLGAKDLVGDDLFFGMQKLSIPLLAVTFLAIATILLAWENSTLSPFARRLARAVFRSKKELEPWATNPTETTTEFVDLSILVSIALSPSHLSDVDVIKKGLRNLTTARQNHGLTYEVIVVFYGDRVSQLHPVVRALTPLKCTSLKLVFEPNAEASGSAVRAGFLASRGKKILVTSLEQGIDLEYSHFIESVLDGLNAGDSLVRGNRRLPESHFRTPVRYLSLVYGRHQLGRVFSKAVQLFTPHSHSPSTDVMSPHFGMTRTLAAQAFALQSTPSALYKLEISLLARTHGLRERDIPISICLNYEKSLSRVFFESLAIAMDFPRIITQNHRGAYHPMSSLGGITADDWGLSPGVNQGILTLAKLGIVKRVSIMANCPYIEIGLDELRSIPGIELGLHFTLTYGRSLSDTRNLIPSPARFLLGWVLASKQARVQDQDFVRAELQAQLQRLTQIGVHAQYLDGHHHIHLVPGLLTTVAEILHKAGVSRVRLPYDSTLWFSKHAPLLLLSLLARPTFRKLGFRYVTCVYPTSSAFQNYSRFRASLVNRTTSATEVIVHPASYDDIGTLEFPDSYQAERVNEFRVLQMMTVEASQARVTAQAEGWIPCEN